MNYVKAKFLHQKLRNSPTIQIFSFCFFRSLLFLFTLKKMSLKVTTKIWQLKNLNYNPNRWTILLLVMRRFLNYTIGLYFFDIQKIQEVMIAFSITVPPPNGATSPTKKNIYIKKYHTGFLSLTCSYNTFQTCVFKPF